MLNRRSFLRSAAVSASSLILGRNALAENKTTPSKTARANTALSRPNIVVIVSDDHRADLLSCMGNPYYKTPHLDRLAGEGVLFENAFATSGVCSPSRGSILTGKYAHQAGTQQIVWMNNCFRASQTPFPARLHNAGYHAAHFGKWHLGRGDLGMPGYDHWEGFEWLGEYFDTQITVNGQVQQFKGFADDILAERAGKYIKERSETGQPFCAFVGLKSPHLNFGYPPRLEHALDDVDVPKPDSYDEDYEKSGRLDYLKRVIDVKTFAGGLPMFDNSWEKYVKSYFRSSMAIDEAVGHILDSIDEAGIAENTIVLYTSDQGYTLGEHGLTEKHFCHEEALRVPMIIRYPKQIKPGARRSEMVLNIDIAPTVLDLCGEAIPDDMSGASWTPLLNAENKPVKSWREDFLFELASQGNVIPGQVMVRTDRYKLITYPWIDKPWRELYDLKKDPREMKSVINDPAYQNVLADMEKRLQRLKRETNWTPVEVSTLDQCWIIGPFPDNQLNQVREQIVSQPYFDVSRNKIVTAGKIGQWQKHIGKNGAHDFTQLPGNQPGHTLFLAIPIERLNENSPYVQINLQPVMPMKGYVNGRKYHDVPGGPGPVNSLRSVFIPPLLAKDNLLILEFPCQNKLSINIWAAKGSLRLP